MALRTYRQMLEDVDTAIMKIESGSQEYTIASTSGSRTLRRGDLAELRRERAYLIEQLNRYGDIIPGMIQTTGAYGVSFE